VARLFSYHDRPVHLGPFPLERLARTGRMPDLAAIAPMEPVPFRDDARPESLANAMARFIGMFDTIRDGKPAGLRAEIPDDPTERANHLKAAGYYFDASQVGICALPDVARLQTPLRNPQIDELRQELEQGQPKTFSSGIDVIYADVLESARTKPSPIPHHTHAIIFMVEYARDPRPDEAGTEWFSGTQVQRAAVLAAQTAVLLSDYIRLLGFEARAHTATSSDVDLGRLAVAAGLARHDASCGAENQGLQNPFVGKRFGLAAVTTTLDMTVDLPLKPKPSLADTWASHGPRWWVGKGTSRCALSREPYATREFTMGEYPFERLKRRKTPTTFIDSARVPRFPKRADFFARALFGDMGKAVQEAAKGGHYVNKSPIGYCARRALGALLLLQFGEARGPVSPNVADPVRNARNIKGATYYLSADAVGVSTVPEWAYYSHNAGGDKLEAYHQNAISVLIDQGHETMEGASGDDWISVAQSMRAYLRFSMIGGIVAEQVRRLGYSARVHSVLDSDVLQPPLLLLAGLGEVSRIGEVILNPYLGPRLKAGTVTTNLPMEHDRPIDFGLQSFCDNCNKCARECPAGAITAGPKLMYNGYEIWKSDAEKCARYRLTNQGGGMCGRCMKTCPWNLEGLFSEAAFRWVAMRVPAAAKPLAKLDDALGRGKVNPVKKWWWDIEIDRKTRQYVRAKQTHARDLSRQLDLKYEDQTLAVYPADVMPPPLPVIHPLDREAGITRYRQLLSPQNYREKLAGGDTGDLAPAPTPSSGPPPVFPVILKSRREMTSEIATYEFAAENGEALPDWQAGAHIDVVIAPEYQRQFSLAGDPADRSHYLLGVLREPGGRGGSALMHRAFREGRRVFISTPRNHFPLDETATRSWLFGGGIGVTPLLTMAHSLHRQDRDFELHYSCHARGQAGFLGDIASAPWADKTQLYFTDEGSRADFASLIPDYEPGFHLYTCGSPRYMDGIFETALAKDWPEEALHREYFTVPEAPDYENHPFVLKLARSDRSLAIPADKTATDVLAENGITVDIKCSDGICGVCATAYDPERSSQIEHRDYVLSTQERQKKVILCCSRPDKAGGEMVVDL